MGAWNARRPDHRVARAACVLAALVAMAACGGDGRSGANPTPTRAGSNISVFGQLPRYPGGRPAASRTRNDNGIVTQSFLVDGTAPETILEFFDRQLAGRGWAIADATSRGATTAPRAVYRKAGRHLVVTSALAPAAGEHDAAADVNSQYSLLLYPRGVDVGS